MAWANPACPGLCPCRCLLQTPKQTRCLSPPAKQTGSAQALQPLQHCWSQAGSSSGLHRHSLSRSCAPSAYLQQPVPAQQSLTWLHLAPYENSTEQDCSRKVHPCMPTLMDGCWSLQSKFLQPCCLWGRQTQQATASFHRHGTANAKAGGWKCSASCYHFAGQILSVGSWEHCSVLPPPHSRAS